MKNYFYSIFLLAFTGVFIYSFSEAKTKKLLKTTHSKSFYDLSIKDLSGNRTIKMSEFKDKKVLCVNVASECGYTPQYEGLQKLADTYKNKLVIIGFPCNQFGGQEPGTVAEIENFCKKNYGVTFLLTEKIDVKGTHQHPVYQWLTQQTLNGKSDAAVIWNFNKFLIDENGNWLAYFPSKVDPMSADITSKVK
ncbi:MAG: glutathione peroxidase [Bacteroidia bacterium]|nr:glutathione peroxidase [Bacteroidia bacterium]